MENLEKKFAEAINANNEKLNAQMSEMKAALDNGVKASDLEGLTASMDETKKANEILLVKMQEQLDTQSTKLKDALLEKSKKEASQDPLKSVIKSNFEELKSIGDNGKKLRYEVKDMTLPVNLIGDQPRDYNYDVVLRPAQMPNVEDLARTIPITGGTYTFVRSTLAANNIATQTEGALKGQNEYTYTMVDANTDFIAGISVYSRKMRNNLPFLERALADDLRRDYYKSENAIFEAILAAQATASTQGGAGKINMLVLDISVLAAANFAANAIVINPADYADILLTETTGGGFDLPGAVTLVNGQLAINGVPIYQASWCPASTYYVGDWSRVSKVVTEGFSFAVSEEDADNFRKNNITARVECQCTLVVEQEAALIIGDFSAT